MLKCYFIFIITLFQIASYAQTKKNKVNVKFNIDNLVSASKMSDWRKNDMTNKIIFYHPIQPIPSIHINKNEKWEIGITFSYINQNYYFDKKKDWQEKFVRNNPDFIIYSGRNLPSLDFSFGYNIKNWLKPQSLHTKFINKSNLYLYAAVKILPNNAGYNIFAVSVMDVGAHYLAMDSYYITNTIALRPKIELTYSYDVFKWLQLRANINYSYIFKDDAPFIFQAGIGFKF